MWFCFEGEGVPDSHSGVVRSPAVCLPLLELGSSRFPRLHITIHDWEPDQPGAYEGARLPQKWFVHRKSEHPQVGPPVCLIRAGQLFVTKARQFAFICHFSCHFLFVR